MSRAAPPSIHTSEAAIFSRLLCSESGRMSPALARHVLTLGFDAPAQERINGLAARNQEGALSPEEKEELLSYVKAGHLLALLHSQARRSLKGRQVS